MAYKGKAVASPTLTRSAQIISNCTSPSMDKFLDGATKCLALKTLPNEAKALTYPQFQQLAGTLFAHYYQTHAQNLSDSIETFTHHLRQMQSTVSAHIETGFDHPLKDKYRHITLKHINSFLQTLDALQQIISLDLPPRARTVAEPSAAAKSPQSPKPKGVPTADTPFHIITCLTAILYQCFKVNVAIDNMPSTVTEKQTHSRWSLFDHKSSSQTNINLSNLCARIVEFLGPLNHFYQKLKIYPVQGNYMGEVTQATDYLYYLYYYLYARNLKPNLVSTSYDINYFSAHNYFQTEVENPFTALFKEAYEQPVDSMRIPFLLDMSERYPIQSDGVTVQLVGCHGIDTNTTWTRRMRTAVETGQGDSYQSQIATRMNIEPNKPAFCLQLGDNFYDDGVCDPGAPGFLSNQAYYGLWSQGERVDNYAVAGNHDYGIWGHYKVSQTVTSGSLSALSRMHCQILHSYIYDDHWNMPNHYYVLFHQFFVIIVLDTNIIMFDQVQQQWFVEAVQKIREKYPNKWIIVAAHHPLVYIGKRAHKTCEWKKYFEQLKGIFPSLNPCIYNQGTFEDITPPSMTKLKSAQSFSASPTGSSISAAHSPTATTAVRAVSSPTTLTSGAKPVSVAAGPKKPSIEQTLHPYNNIGKFMLALMEKNKLPIDVYLAAHEHATAVHTIKTTFSPNIAQIISGGGGAKLSAAHPATHPGGKFNPIETLPGVSSVEQHLVAECFSAFALRIEEFVIHFKTLSLQKFDFRDAVQEGEDLSPSSHFMDCEQILTSR